MWSLAPNRRRPLSSSNSSEWEWRPSEGPKNRDTLPACTSSGPEKERQTDKTKRLIYPRSTVYAYSLHLKVHHLALNYSSLCWKKYFSRIMLSSLAFSLQFTHIKIPKTSTGFPLLEKNVSWLDLKLPNPLWFNTSATHADREEIQ